MRQIFPRECLESEPPVLELEAVVGRLMELLNAVVDEEDLVEAAE